MIPLHCFLLLTRVLLCTCRVGYILPLLVFCSSPGHITGVIILWGAWGCGKTVQELWRTVKWLGWNVITMGPMYCHWSGKKVVLGTKLSGKMVSLVQTWNNGTSTMFDYGCRLWKGYGSALKVVSSIREPRYVTRKERQLPEVASFPWNQWCALIGALALAPVPGEPPNQSENVLQMGTRTCGNVGAVDKENTSLRVLNVPLTVLSQGVVISPIRAILRAQGRRNALISGQVN